MPPAIPKALRDAGLARRHRVLHRLQQRRNRTLLQRPRQESRIPRGRSMHHLRRQTKQEISRILRPAASGSIGGLKKQFGEERRGRRLRQDDVLVGSKDSVISACTYILKLFY